MKTLLDYFVPFNKKIFPMQIITLIVSIILTCLLFFLPSIMTTVLMKIYLILTFVWIGIAYLYMMEDIKKTLPFSAIAPGITCIVIAVLFLLNTISTEGIYKLSTDSWRFYISVILMIWGWILYPLSGLAAGHRYPKVPLFGVVMCPTAIFAIGFLTAVVSNPFEMAALCILSLMGIVAGFRAAIRGYDGERVYEDLALLAAGIYGLVIWGLLR